MKIICIIQARTTSTRLPNKVLLDLKGKTILQHIIERVEKSELIDSVVIATTINETDDKIEELCKNLGVDCFRGSENDVLSRYYECAKKYNPDYVIRVTSDCPCIDYKVLNKLIIKHLDENNDYTSNSLERSFPHGLDCEIFSFKLLEEANMNAIDNFEKEHVTPYMYKTRKDLKISQLIYDKDYSKIRITVDTKEDYELMTVLYDYLYLEDSYFDTEDIIDFFNKRPYLSKLNNNIVQKKVCVNLEEELNEALNLLERQDLSKAKDFLIQKIKENK